MSALNPAEAARFREALRAALSGPALDWAEPPDELAGGFENRVVAARLAKAPALAQPLILRIYAPDRPPETARFEATVHCALADQGYPAPRVHVFREASAGRPAFTLMDRAPGRVLLSRVAHLGDLFSGPGALVGIPRLVHEAAFRVPVELARLMLDLHALDAERVWCALGDADLEPARFTPGARVDQLRARAERAGLAGLIPVLEWLRERRPAEPAPGDRVVCHSDFHFLNVLVDGRTVTGVIDWSIAHFAFAEREFDVGNACALYSLEMPMPAVVGSLFARLQRRLRDGFRRHYEARTPLDPEAVRWAEVFRFAREMVPVAERLATGRPPRHGTPWEVPSIRAGVLRALRAHTGLPVSLPAAPHA